MNVIRRARMGGKTTELLRRALEVQNAVIVVHDYNTARSIKVDYNVETITFQQFIEGTILRGRTVTLFIDNVDILLQRIAGPLLIDTITVTTNSE